MHAILLSCFILDFSPRQSKEGCDWIARVHVVLFLFPRKFSFRFISFAIENFILQTKFSTKVFKYEYSEIVNKRFREQLLENNDGKALMIFCQNHYNWPSYVISNVISPNYEFPSIKAICFKFGWVNTNNMQYQLYDLIKTEKRTLKTMLIFVHNTKFWIFRKCKQKAVGQ